MDERLLVTPCVIVTVTAGSPDVYGDPVEAESTTYTRCHYRQLQTKEFEGKSVEQSVWRVYLPGSIDLRGSDRLVIAGESYTLSGDPYPVRRPTTGLVDHVECLVERTR